MRSKWSDNIMKFFSLQLLLIRPHYLRQFVPSIIRDDSIRQLTYSVHIWHALCVWVRDLYVPLCTLATGRGVHITSTGKGHTKHKAKKQNINKEDKISCVFVSRRQPRSCSLFFTFLFLSSSPSSFKTTRGQTSRKKRSRLTSRLTLLSSHHTRGRR